MKIKQIVTIPNFEQGNTLLIGFSIFKSKCNCCESETVVIEIGVIFILYQIQISHF